MLLLLNVAAFLGIAAYAGTLMLPGRTLLAFGALYPGALAHGGVWGGGWRLVASGFLHFSPIHLLFNMVCLVSWGTAVERRLGLAWFLLLYAASLLGGGLVAMTEPRGITAGASGAISGLLGALLYLSLRRMVDMPLAGIAATVALNVAFTFGASSISWRGHLGGFAAGLLTCLGLQAASWVAARTLRCRFPEWLTLDLLLIAVLAAAIWRPDGPVAAGLLLLDIALVVKAADLALCLQRGTALVAAVALAAQAGLLAWAGVRFGVPGLGASSLGASGLGVPGLSVSSLGMSGLGVAAALAAASVWLHLAPLRRGLRDQGFIAAGLQAERRRVQGL